uniref:Sulfatase-modifying factor enzyme domain-containing protein n=1 Tax=uncultured bacterium contig00106 TaxID=1181572 RepID=A0A806K2Z5_9BACT|nr:hypothetical protein [uncultured bacterium contig00106]
MNKILIFVAFVFIFSFAKQYGIYDLQGNYVSAFEAEPHELSEKVRQFKAENPSRNLYISSLAKGKSPKPIFRYRYKAETGAYIEASRKETFSICPDKEIQGTWISEYSVSLNAENCLSVQAPNLAGTFRILFLQNSGRTDTVRVLVEQSYIQMGDYSHRVWVNDSIPEFCKYGNVCKESDYGHYENKKYNQALIVDKTEFTMGDAQRYSGSGINLAVWNASWISEAYPPNEDLKTSMRPYIDDGSAIWQIANMRSKLEGLDTVYSIFSENGQSKLVTDTSAFGYRLPFKDEWGMLMRAGVSTRYYWGDEEDSLTVSRYTLVRPAGYIQHKVAQKLPNAFGLYDMISPNNTAGADGSVCTSSPNDNQMRECRFITGIVARRIECKRTFYLVSMDEAFNESAKKEKLNLSCRDFNATSARYLYKAPKLRKLEKM